jgi:hypothetical protein
VSERPPLASVDSVREELRRLGYLDSGIDRFVLGAAGGESPLRASLRAALRVGLLGGTLAAGALALLAVGLDRRLLLEPRDLALLLAYLWVALGLATGGAAWLAGLAAAWAARRLGRPPAPGLPRNLGLAVGVAVLAYLALWWRSHGAGAAPAVHAAALAVGLALSVALGRFASLAAVAVLSAGGAAPRLPQASLSRRHLLPLLAGATLAIAAGVTLAAHLGRRAPLAPDYAVVPTGLRVCVVGIDGLEAGMAEQMLARGAMPRLATLFALGARARLRAEPERVPAIVWTTIATGRGPEAHGIRAAGVRRLPGMRTPVPQAESRLVSALGAATDLLRITRAQPLTSVLRSVKTFWNVASDKGLRVGVVNWWATWPADAVNGYVVSDRAVFKLEKGGASEHEVHPPELFEALRALLPPPEGPDAGPAARARRLDRFHIAAARRLRDGAPPDIEALYLPGLDIVTAHELGEAPMADLASLDRRLDAVRAYYAFADELIGGAAAGLGPRDVLVLVGDPGRLARSGTAPAEGLLVLAGGPVVAIDLGRVSSRDVAPTVLHLVGLPVSRELDGLALEAALAADFRAAHPLRVVDGYGRRPSVAPAESSFDEQMLEELRSLGYIQ